MPDPYLEAMMHGDSANKERSEMPDRFDSAIDKEINQYIDTLNIELENTQNNLLPRAARKAKIFSEIKDAFTFSNLNTYFSIAFRLLKTEGKSHLQKEEFQQLEKEFSQIPEILDQMDLNSEFKENFKTIFKLSDPVMESILKIGSAEFNQELYQESLSIFALLTTLDSGNAVYWMEFGIAAQKFQNYDLALRSYEAASGIDPSLIGAKLFAVECYLQKEQPDQAKQALQEAKQIADTTEVEPEWLYLLNEISKII